MCQYCEVAISTDCRQIGDSDKFEAISKFDLIPGTNSYVTMQLIMNAKKEIMIINWMLNVIMIGQNSNAMTDIKCCPNCGRRLDAIQ